MSTQPRILLLGDYSNCHRTLATGLRQLDCEVTVASDGSRWQDCDRDITISRKKGRFKRFFGLSHLLRLRKLLSSSLSGFDIVSFHDPQFGDLRTFWMNGLFDMLRANNKSVFYTDMTTDTMFLDMLAAPDSPVRYSEWFIDGQPARYHLANLKEWRDWHKTPIQNYQKRLFNEIDGAVSVLYEYDLSLQRCMSPERHAYGGIPVDLSLYDPVELPDRPRKIKFFLGRDRNRKLLKGTDLLEAAARDVVARYPDRAELTIVENRPFNEFIDLMRDSHVVLDQIYSYTPATTALMAMAYGLNAVSGAEPEFYDFIGEHDNRPVINAPIELEPLTRTLEDLVLHPELIRERGIRSRQFVAKHNDCRIVAKRFLDFWLNRLEAKNIKP